MTKRHMLLFLLFLLFCSPRTERELERKIDHINQYPVNLPDETPGQWLLAFIDVETTGLIPGYHEMIDIGIVMTDLDGRILDSLFLRIRPKHPERLSPGAYAVNAYEPEHWRQMGALSRVAAVDSILKFHKRTAGIKNVLMVAYNCRFDTAFLDFLFRSAGRTWRELYYYYVLDIPSMAWGLGLTDLRGRDIMQMYRIEDEPHVAEKHTGMTGAMVNVRIYRALLTYRREKLNAQQ